MYVLVIDLKRFGLHYKVWRTEVREEVDCGIGKIENINTNDFLWMHSINKNIWTEVRIYWRKQDSKKKWDRKPALDQETDQKSNQEKVFFLDHFLGRERVFFSFFLTVIFFSSFLGRLLGRECVLCLFFLSLSYFLVFYYQKWFWLPIISFPTGPSEMHVCVCWCMFVV